MNKPVQDKYLSIKNAAKELKVSKKTLRRWEAKGILIPSRTTGGHRRYQLSQLETFKKNKNKKRYISSNTPIVSSLDYQQIKLSSLKVKPQEKKKIVRKINLKKGDLPILYETFHPKQKKFLKFGALFTLSFLLSIIAVKSVNTFIRNFEINTYIRDKAIESLSKVGLGRYIQISREDSEKQAQQDNKQKVLALTSTSISDQSFNVYIKTNIKDDLDVEGDISINGTNVTTTSESINLFNNNALSINFGGESTNLSIGSDTSTVNINNNLDVSGNVSTSTITIANDTFDDLTGSGLQISDGELQTTIGDTVESADIADGTITEADLSVTNSPTDNYILSYDSSTGTFTWVADQTGSGTNYWTDDGIVTYLTSLTDDLAIGGVDSSSPLFFDESTGILNVTGDLSVGSIQLGSAGTGPANSGASLIGVFDELTNSSATNIQDVLDDLDAALGAGGSKFTQDTNFIYLTNTTDSISVGGTTELGKIGIQGDADQVQLFIRGNATQTSNVITAEQSGGTDLFTLNNSGNLYTLGNITSGGDLNLGAATIDFNGTGTIQYADGSIFNITDDSGNSIIITNASNNLTLGDSAATLTLQSNDWGIDSSGDASGFGAITANGTITLSGLAAGNTDSILVQNAGNVIAARSIDTRVWGSTLLDNSDLLWTNTANVYHPIAAYAQIADLVIGGTATTGASLHVNATTGDLTMAGDLTVTGNTITFGNAESIDNTIDGTIIFGTDETNGAGVIRLPIKTTSGDPSLNSVGNMYYNSFDNVFRCYTSSGWINCDTTGGIENYWELSLSTLSPGGGSSNDTDKLVIGGANTTAHQFEVSGAQTGKALVVFNETGDQDIFTASSGGTTRFVIDHGGNVGIGSSDPAYTLEVTDSVSGLVRLQNTNSGIWQSSALDFFNNNASSFFSIGINSSNHSTDPGAAFLWQYYAYPIRFGTSSVERMRISATGLIGIGDITPDALLDVEGKVTGQALVQLNETGDQDILVASASGSTVFRLARNGNITSTGDLTITGGDIVGANDESIDIGEIADDTITFLSNDSVITLSLSGTAAVIANTAGDITFNAADGNIVFSDADTFIIGGHAGNVAYNVISDAGGSPSSGQVGSDNDLYVQGTIEAGSLYQGANQVCDTSGNCSGVTSYWSHIDQAVYTTKYWADDLLIGGNSTDSATFRIAASGLLEFANDETISNSSNGSLVFADSGGNTITFDLDATNPTLVSSTTALGLDDDLQFIGAQSITTTTGALTISPANNFYTLVQNDTGGDATFQIDQLGDGDIFTASSGGTTRFVIDNNGHVGIGTPNPNYTFEIVNNMSGLVRLQNTNSGVGQSSALDFFNDDASSQFAIGVNSTNHFAAPSSGYLWMYAQYPMRFGTGGTERMRIAANGLIGIGDITPEALLDVEGKVTGKALVQLNETGDQDILVASASGSTVFRLARNGDVLSYNNIGINYDANSNNLLSTSIAGGAPSGSLYWGNLEICDSSGNCPSSALWSRSANAISTTQYWADDLLIGGNSTDSANLRIAANGEIFVTPQSALTTGIDLTDTDLTNALSIGDNNIIGTTSAIDFTYFDVASTGALTFTPGTTGTYTNYVLETEWTAGDLINIDWDSATSQSAASLTLIDLDFTNLTAAASQTTYGLHINDLQTDTGGIAGNQYAIYQEGSNWDFGGFFEDNLGLATNTYLNWGTTSGSSGYGIRDNSGAIEFKNQYNSWTQIASQSAAFERAKYDRIVDAEGGGTDHTIASAIANASAGDSIFIAPGTYNENVTIDKELKIFGAGRDAVTIAGSANSPTISISNSVGSVELHNFSASNAGNTDTDDNVITMGSGNTNSIIENLTVSGGYIGISWSGSNYSQIRNNYITGTAYRGIQISGGEGSVIQGNTIYSTGGDAVAILQSDSTNVIGNAMTNWGDNNDCIDIYDNEHFVISGNTCDGVSSAENGFYINESTDVAITGNTIRAVNEVGIIFPSSGSKISITGNIITDNGTYGIDLNDSTVTNVLITGNTIINNSSGAIVNNSGTGNRIFANNTNNTGAIAEEFSILDTTADTLFTFSNPDSSYITDLAIEGGISLGKSTAPVSLLDITSQNLPTFSGKALAIFDQYEAMDILTASASGTTRFRLTNGGNIVLSTGSNYINFGSTEGTSGYGIRDNGGTMEYKDSADGGWSSFDSLAAGSINYWQLNSQQLAPGNTTYDLMVGGTSTGSAQFAVYGIETTTGGVADIASDITTTGTVFGMSASALTTGTLLDLSSSSLTTGTLLNVTSTSTALGSESGLLANFDWSPTSWATSSGDLFTINLGQYGDVTGNLFRITDNGSDIFRVSTTQIESAVPHSFTAAGDVTIAYDLKFSNQTSSNIKTSAPFTIDVGDSFESNNLVINTYNNGNIIFTPGSHLGGFVKIQDSDPSIIYEATTSGDTDFWAGLIDDAGSDDDDYFGIGDGTTPGTNTFLSIDTSGKVGIGTTTPTSRLHIATNTTNLTGKSALIIDQLEGADIFTASASGTTVMTLGRTGNLSLINSGSSNINFNLSSSGDLTISDNGTPFATFTDGGVFTLDSLNFDGTTIGLTTDTNLLTLASDLLTIAGNLSLQSNGYLNFGSTSGSGGYGIRDNSGAIEFKNQYNSWTQIASQSAAFERAKYDRIVDAQGGGTDHTITAAIANASAGDSIFIAPGTYNENVTIDKELKIFGAGAGATIISGVTGSATVTISAGIDNVEIHNLEIANSGSVDSTDNGITVASGSSNDDLLFENIEFSDGDRGIQATTGTRMRIANCYFTNIERTAMYISGVTNSVITGNTVITGTIDGIASLGSDNTTISNNYIIGGDYGILLNDSERNAVTGNTVVNSGQGIYVLSGSHYASVTGNTIENSIYSGVRIEDSSHTSVTGNTIYSAADGIHVSGTSTNTTISGNISSENSSYGINLGGSNVTDAVVTGNTFVGNTGGAIENNTGIGNRVFANNTDATGSLAEEFSILDTTADTLFTFSNPDSSYITDLAIEGGLNLGNTTAPTSLLFASTQGLPSALGKAVAIFDQYEDMDILSASASGTTMLTLGRSGDLSLFGSQADLRLYDSTGYYTGFQAPADMTGTSNYLYTMPSGYPSSNYILQSNSSGVLSWIDPGSLPSINNWTLSENTLYPNDYWADDLIIGGNSTASAKFHVNATNGNVTSQFATTLTSGSGYAIDWSGATTQADASLAGLYIDLTQVTPDNDKGLYGIHINDAASAGAGSLEYAIYQQGTNWDFGGFFEDNLGLASSGYLNWGTTAGSSGYGIRDNSGAIEFKNQYNSWTQIASQSAAFERAKYDIIVDAEGGGHYTTLTAAIANASAGDSIFIAPGTYTETVTIDKSLKLFGAGQDATVITRGTGNDTITINDSIGIVEIHNLTVSNSGSASSDDVIVIGSNNSYSVLENLKISGGYYGIYWQNSYYGRIINNYITGSAYRALVLGNADSTIIQGNVIYNVEDDAIMTGTADNISIIGNTITDWGSESFEDCMDIYNGNHITISSNACDGTSNSGRGIFLNQVSEVTITGNTIKDTTGSTIAINNATASDQITFTGNIITDSTGGYGIDLGGSNVTNVLVSGNIILGNSSGTITNNSGNGNRVFGNNTDATGSIAEEFSISDTTADTLFTFSNPNASYITDLAIEGGISLGKSTAPVSLLDVTSQNLPTFSGKAVAIFDQYEAMDILTASASGTTRFRLTNGGNIVLSTGSNYINFGSTEGTSGYGIRDNGGTMEYKDSADGGWSSFDSLAAWSTNYWQLNSQQLAPGNTTYDLLIGATSTGSAQFAVYGIETVTGGVADITSDVTTTGTVFGMSASALTTGTLLDLSSSSLTTGTLLNVTSTSTALGSDTGLLANFDWSPTTWATSSGDLFTINIGQYGDVTGNLFRITDNGSDIFRVSTTQIESAVPHTFSAAGDVSFAYDAIFTNQTIAGIESWGPLTITSGESFESNNLTLKTYNSGDIVLDPGIDGSVIIGATTSGQFRLHVADDEISTASAMIENLNTGGDADGLLIKLGFTSSTGSTSNSFIDFRNGNSVQLGQIRASGTSPATIQYQTAGADYAEYFNKDSSYNAEIGDIVAINPSTSKVTATTKEYEGSVIGIVSGTAGFVGGKESPNAALVGISGQLPVKIAPYSESISAGDYLTTSNEKGKAMKATSAGPVIAKALENWSPVSGKDSIKVYINIGWHEPDLAMIQSGDLNIGITGAENINELYQLTDSGGNVIDNLGGFAKVFAANVEAGFAKVASLISSEIQTEMISPVPGNDININLIDSTGAYRVLNILGENGQRVVGFDKDGNAILAGKLTADSIETTVLTADEIYAGKIVADKAAFGDMFADTISGITREEIESILAEAEIDQKLLNQASDWNTSSATGSALLNEAVLENIFVTGDAVFGSLSISQSLVIGNDLVISSTSTPGVENALTPGVVSFDTLSAPLSIQSSASQPLLLMAGLVTIDTDGNVSIAGDLAVAGKVQTTGVILNSFKDTDQPLTIKDVLGANIASINASGSAQFIEIGTGKVKTNTITLINDPEATSSAGLAGLILKSNASAGSAKIPANEIEVTLVNPNIKADSLIFITPTSKSTEILYIKSQKDGETIIGFDQTAENDVTFNWWLVGLQ